MDTIDYVFKHKGGSKMLTHDMMIGIWLGVTSVCSVLYLKEHASEFTKKENKEKK